MKTYRIVFNDFKEIDVKADSFEFYEEGFLMFWDEHGNFIKTYSTNIIRSLERTNM